MKNIQATAFRHKDEKSDNVSTDAKNNDGLFLKTIHSPMEEFTTTCTLDEMKCAIETQLFKISFMWSTSKRNSLENFFPKNEKGLGGK